MESLFASYRGTGNFYHAYLLLGNPKALTQALTQFFEHEVLGESVADHPDVWQAEFDLFGINESRDIRERQTRRPIKSERQYIIVTIHFITEEAQNALLKTLEEPTGNAHIFLIARSEDLFLPTVRSRCQVIKMPTPAEAISPELMTWSSSFLQADPQARLVLLEPLLKTEAEEGVSKRLLLDYLDALEILLHRALHRQPELAPAIELLGQTRSYLYDRASSPRLLFERLTFLIPKL